MKMIIIIFTIIIITSDDEVDDDDDDDDGYDHTHIRATFFNPDVQVDAERWHSIIVTLAAIPYFLQNDGS